jgi:hypothetical protein
LKELDDFSQRLEQQKFTDIKRRLTANEKMTAERFKECQELGVKHRDHLY